MLPTGYFHGNRPVVLETATLYEVDLAAYCRSNGLYVEQIAQWRAQCEAAFNPKPAALMILRKKSGGELGIGRRAMISTPDRRRIITLINEAVARLLKACDVLNLTMRTIQRWRLSDGTVREDARATAWRATPSNKLSNDERVRILQTIKQPELANLPPGAILPTFADRELFLGS